MKEYDHIVDEAWQAIAERRSQVFSLISELWETKYKYRYIQWIFLRKQRMTAENSTWEQFAK